MQQATRRRLYRLSEPASSPVRPIVTRSAILALAAALAVSASGCTREKPTTGGHPTISMHSTADQRSIESVVESVRPGSSTGFDPSTYADAINPAAILPEGATLRVVDGSWDIDGETASVDVVVTTPGAPERRHWVFLRKTDGAWLIVGTLPLDAG